MDIQIITIAGILIGLILAGWGLFHQLIVGAAVTLIKNISEESARIVIMSWVAQGAFMSFTGIISSSMLFLHGVYSDAVQTTMVLCGISMLLLSLHVMASGYKTHIKPIRIGAALEFIYGLSMLTIVMYV